MSQEQFAQLIQQVTVVVQQAAAAQAAQQGNQLDDAAVEAIVNQRMQQQAQVPFATNPGGSGNEVRDMTSNSSLKYYSMATAAFPGEKPYAGETDKLVPFLACIENRARTMGFQTVLIIADDSGTGRSLINEHGSLTLANMRTAGTTDLANEDARHQRCDLLYDLLMATVDRSLVRTLKTKAVDYDIDVNGNRKPHGPTYLFVLIKHVALQTRATRQALLNR